MSLYSRARDSRQFEEAMRLNVEQELRVADRYRRGVVAQA